MARPIFVLGLQRSGTTWVGNILSAHPEVAGVTAIRHSGIHESLFFSHFAQAWDWSDPYQRSAAIDAFLTSDYGRLMDLTAEDQAQVRMAETPAAAFGRAMDAVAGRKGAAHWVEKSPHHTRHAQEIAEVFPDAMFVALHRRTGSLLTSRLGAYYRTPPRGLKRALAILRAAAANTYHKRLIDQLARAHPDRVVRLDYKLFKNAGPIATQQLLADLHLPPQPGLKSLYPANSTSRVVARVDRKLRHRDRFLAACADVVFALTPSKVLAMLRGNGAEKTVVFPAWVWAEPEAVPDHVDVATPRKAKA